MLKRLRQAGFADCRGDHHDRADRPRHARRVPRQRLRDLPRPPGARRNAAARAAGRTAPNPATAVSAERRSACQAARRADRQPGLSVLVAEDNEINAMLARATLLKAGHRVEVVGNGKAAVEARDRRAARKRRYDVVLMDLHMPVMDGLDAIAAIRRYEEEAGVAPVPIMVLSADSQEKTRHAVLAHGASGFVTKPLDPEALVRRSRNRPRPERYRCCSRLPTVAPSYAGYTLLPDLDQASVTILLHSSVSRRQEGWLEGESPVHAVLPERELHHAA